MYGPFHVSWAFYDFISSALPIQRNKHCNEPHRPDNDALEFKIQKEHEHQRTVEMRKYNTHILYDIPYHLYVHHILTDKIKFYDKIVGVISTRNHKNTK